MSAKDTNSSWKLVEITSINSFSNNYEFFPEICRICLSVVKNNLHTIYNKFNAQEISHHAKLYFCCPELDLRINSNSTLCVKCFETIQIIYKFTHNYHKSKSELCKHSTFTSIEKFQVFGNSRFISKDEIKIEEVDLYDTEKDSFGKYSQIHNTTKPFKQNNFKTNIYTPIDKKPLKCSVCDYSSTIKSNLKTHLRIHIGKKPFKCSLCDYAGTTKTYLKNHLRVHTGEKLFKCSHCDFSCNCKGDLKRHLRIYTGEKPFKCSACNYRSVTKNNLDRHYRLHTGEKPFKCSHCNFNCNQKGDLKRHLRVHTGEKPFKCLVCNHSSTTKSSMKRHIFTHTGEKPFKCSHCNYSCIRKDNLKRHMCIHTEEMFESG